jgi:hypothetical protein
MIQIMILQAAAWKAEFPTAEINTTTIDVEGVVGVEVEEGSQTCRHVAYRVVVRRAGKKGREKRAGGGRKGGKGGKVWGGRRRRLCALKFRFREMTNW